MGAIAEALVAYAQPLLDGTDGSEEELNRAFTMSQLCYNLALLPEDKREAELREMQPALQMNDAEFNAFRSTLVIPMIQRHQEMFPLLHGWPRALALAAAEGDDGRRSLPGNRPLRPVSLP